MTDGPSLQYAGCYVGVNGGGSGIGKMSSQCSRECIGQGSGRNGHLLGSSLGQCSAESAVLVLILHGTVATWQNPGPVFTQ